MPTSILAKCRRRSSSWRDDLHNALVKSELRTQAVERLEARNRFLEAELVRLERELTNKAKDAIVARQQAAAKRPCNGTAQYS